MLDVLIGLALVLGAYRFTCALAGGHDACRGMTLAQAALYYNDPRPEWRAYARQTFRARLTGRPRLQSPSKKA